MSASVTVGLLHPGRMGAAITAQIRSNGHTVLWCPDGRSPATQHRAVDTGLRPVSLGQLLADSEIVLSICPPAVAEKIATKVAEIGYCGIYVDANAISPARMQDITTRSPQRGRLSLTDASLGHHLADNRQHGFTSPEPRPGAVGSRTCSPARWLNLSFSGIILARPAR